MFNMDTRQGQGAVLCDEAWPNGTGDHHMHTWGQRRGRLPWSAAPDSSRVEGQRMFARRWACLPILQRNTRSCGPTSSFVSGP